MESLNFSWSNVIAGDGLSTALMGMTIVFAGLVTLSLYIALLPKLLNLLNSGKKKAAFVSSVSATQGSRALSEEELAAVGYVVHAEQQRLIESDLRVTIPSSGDARSAWALSSKMRTFPNRAAQ